MCGEDGCESAKATLNVFPIGKEGEVRADV